MHFLYITKQCLHSRVLGFPMPEVEWLKDSRPVTDNPDYKTSYEEGVCTLTIEETFTEDSALFICRAVNGAGIAETSAILTVKGKAVLSCYKHLLLSLFSCNILVASNSVLQVVLAAEYISYPH